MKSRLFSKIAVYFRLMRVSDWIKNLFVFVPWLFAKQAFNQVSTVKIITAFISFCFISSFIYVLNDRFDIESDRRHPVKKLRPIASGQIGITEANLIMAILLIVSYGFSFFLNLKFILVLIVYTALNYFYSWILKNIVLVDIFSIAGGFVLRIAAGAAAVDVAISKWLLLTTLFISLFLAAMKRRAELLSVNGNNNSRKVLADYNPEIINQISIVASTGVVICYALYTVAEQTISKFSTERLIYTTVFVIFGIFRYMYLAQKKENTENVAEVIIKDKPMLINLLLYIITVTIIIYFS